MDDLCSHLEWNPSTAAATLAGYAGVAGSITLTVIVIMLGHDDLAETRIGAILLFTVSLFEMGGACVFFSVFAGEQNCLRSYLDVVTTSPSLSIGTVTIMAGITWMFDVFETDTDLERISRLLAYSTIAVALGLHAMLAWTLLDDLTTTHAWTDHGLPATTMLGLLAAALAFVFTIARYRPAGHVERQTALRRASYLTIALTLLQLILAMLFHVFFQHLWTPSARPWLVYVATTTSATTPMVTFAALVRCLPATRPPNPATTSNT